MWRLLWTAALRDSNRCHPKMPFHLFSSCPPLPGSFTLWPQTLASPASPYSGTGPCVCGNLAFWPLAQAQGQLSTLSLTSYSTFDQQILLTSVAQHTGFLLSGMLHMVTPTPIASPSEAKSIS